MSRIRARAIATFLAIPLGSSPALAAGTAVVAQESDLERFPVCEASAAIEMPCRGDATKTCIWVADNEQSGDLFEYDVNGEGQLSPSAKWKIPIGDENDKEKRYDDIEALARDGSALLAIGSHGRNNSCEQKDPRARVVRVAGSTAEAKRAASDKKWKKALAECGDALIALSSGDSEAAARELRGKTCTIIQAEEAAAEHYATAHPKQKDCRETPFNVEGAVSIPEDGKERVWIGLRAPLVEGRALLLRVVLPDDAEKHLTFDGIATIDLKGKAIRELARNGDELWGIAGTVLDSSTEKSVLWRIPVAALKSGATIEDVDLIYDQLPPTSEGLVVQSDPKRAIVLIDGGLHEDEKRCETSARQLTLRLP